MCLGWSCQISSNFVKFRQIWLIFVDRSSWRNVALAEFEPRDEPRVLVRWLKLLIAEFFQTLTPYLSLVNVHHEISGQPATYALGLEIAVFQDPQLSHGFDHPALLDAGLGKEPEPATLDAARLDLRYRNGTIRQNRSQGFCETTNKDKSLLRS